MMLMAFSNLALAYSLRVQFLSPGPKLAMYGILGYAFYLSTNVCTKSK